MHEIIAQYTIIVQYYKYTIDKVKEKEYHCIVLVLNLEIRLDLATLNAKRKRRQ